MLCHATPSPSQESRDNRTLRLRLLFLPSTGSQEQRKTLATVRIQTNRLCISDVKKEGQLERIVTAPLARRVMQGRRVVLSDYDAFDVLIKSANACRDV